MPHKSRTERQEYLRKWNEENRERKQRTNRAWYERNREKIKKRSQDWYFNNHARARETRKKYALENVEKIRLHAKYYRKTIPAERSREYQTRYQNSEKGKMRRQARYAIHKEKYREANKRYYLRNLEKMRIKSQKYSNRYQQQRRIAFALVSPHFPKVSYRVATLVARSLIAKGLLPPNALDIGEVK